MFAELGIFSLILAFLCSLALGFIPSLGLGLRKKSWQEAAPFYAAGLFVFNGLAFFCLALCFLRNDFSVAYVFSHSSLSLPWFYKLCALWGGHEGSMLLWVSLLSLWTLAFCLYSYSHMSSLHTRVLIVLGWLSSGFLLFLLVTSNPFLRRFVPFPVSGQDLNPLLQDPGFLLHPPLLYMGYVGTALGFAWAIALLWEGSLEGRYFKAMRPFVLLAWSCLTLGITLGSWWAYRELGWGGWWFWDPVENASLMPWLTGTALLHVLSVSEKKEQFQLWTLLLAILSFALSLIGTFLVRSGILTSVHAFAVDPERGIYLLLFMLLVIGGALSLFSVRAFKLQNKKAIFLFSREGALLLNNVFMTALMLTVFLGTLYPLFLDSLNLGKLSVGAPYFNAVVVPLSLPFLFLMGLGPHLAFGKNNFLNLLKRLKGLLTLSFLLSLFVLACFYHRIYLGALLGLGLAFWIVLTSLKQLYIHWQEKRLRRLGSSVWGMFFAHIGIAITAIGISLSSYYGIQKDLVMELNEIVQLGAYQIRFLQQNKAKGPNYQALETVFEIRKGKNKTFIFPEKRRYDIGQMVKTKAAIQANLFRDIYIALGEQRQPETWSLRIYYKPFVRWIWGGGFFMLVGGLFALMDKRYYRRSLPNLSHEKGVFSL